MEQKPMLKSNSKKLRGGLLLLLGIVTAVIAQITLLLSTPNLTVYFVASKWWENSWNNTSPIPGVTLYILAGVFFILGLRSLNDSLPTLPIHTDNHSQRQPKFGFWAISLVLSGTVAVYASRASGDDPYGYLFSAAWILGIVLLVINVLVDAGWQLPSMSAISTWLKAHRAELIVIAAIIIAAFLIRFVDVELHPYSFINDEGHMGSEGEGILQGTYTHFFSLGWADQPILAFLPYAISIELLGRTALAVRLVSVIAGTLSVLAVYLLAREIFDRKIAWISAILLATLPVHVHFSRTGIDNIIDSLTAPLLLWLLFRGAKRGSMLSFLAAGIVAGLCIYTYPGSLLSIGLGVGALGYMALRTRGFLQAHLRNIMIFAFAAIIVIIPMLGYYSTNPDMFLSRMKKEGILQSDRLQEETDASGASPAEILAQQFAKSSLVFIATGAPINFFNSPKPYLPAAEAIIFMLGMAYILWRIKDSRYMVVFVWFWAAVILGSTLTGGAPTSQRMLMSMPALVIIIAIGITKILGAFKQLHQPTARFAPILLLGFILCIGYANINYYFYEYRIGHYYEEPANELTYETSAYIAPLYTQGRMFLISNPETPYLLFESFHYFSPDVEKHNLYNITQETLAGLPHDKDILFIALPEYKPSLELISQWMPGGNWMEFKRRYQPQYMLFYSYKITKEQLAAITP
jgi:hypothetical protein